MTPDLPPVRRLRRALLLATLAAGAGLPWVARGAAPKGEAPTEGVALDVQDGDSFVFRGNDGVRRRIRVSGIDAPEKHQPFADASRRGLGAMLRGRRILVEPIKSDVFGRTVARVVALDGPDAGRDLGLAQVEAGLAWHFARFKAEQAPDDRVRYAQAERAARAERAGLWRDDAPEAPWDFRARLRRGEAAPAATPRPARAG